MIGKVPCPTVNLGFFSLYLAVETLEERESALVRINVLARTPMSSVQPTDASVTNLHLQIIQKQGRSLGFENGN